MVFNKIPNYLYIWDKKKDGTCMTTYNFKEKILKNQYNVKELMKFKDFNITQNCFIVYRDKVYAVLCNIVLNNKNIIGVYDVDDY